MAVDLGYRQMKAGEDLINGGRRKEILRKISGPIRENEK